MKHASAYFTDFAPPHKSGRFVFLPTFNCGAIAQHAVDMVDAAYCIRCIGGERGEKRSPERSYSHQNWDARSVVEDNEDQLFSIDVVLVQGLVSMLIHSHEELTKYRRRIPSNMRLVTIVRWYAQAMSTSTRKRIKYP